MLETRAASGLASAMLTSELSSRSSTSEAHSTVALANGLERVDLKGPPVMQVQASVGQQVAPFGTIFTHSLASLRHLVRLIFATLQHDILTDVIHNVSYTPARPSSESQANSYIQDAKC